MKKSLAKKSLVLVTLLAAICMVSISYAGDTSKTKTVAEKGAALQQLENAAGIKKECAKAPEPKGVTVKTSSITASDDDVDKSTTTTTSLTKGGDGAACSSNDECKSGVCEGGSCCTAHGASCNSNSHCCGHQSCTNGTCP